MKLKIENLCKTYRGGTVALNDVNLTIGAGMFGLLGPNGAGKSTLMRTIASLQEADRGSIHLDGYDIAVHKDRLRRCLGYLPQEFGVYPRVSAQRLLDHFAVLKGIPKKQRKQTVDYLLRLTNLYEVRKKSLGSFSGGMKQRFGIAQALLGNPKLVIVDEPTAGLDPAERDRFHNLLHEIGKDVIVILSTHLVNDVQELCNRMAVFHQGQVQVEGEPSKLTQQLQGRIWHKLAVRADLVELEERYNLVYTSQTRDNIDVHVYAETQPGQDFQALQPNLKDVYFCAVKGYFAGGPA